MGRLRAVRSATAACGGSVCTGATPTSSSCTRKFSRSQSADGTEHRPLLKRHILTCGALGRLCFEHGDLQHRRTLNAALISLKLPVRPLSHVSPLPVLYLRLLPCWMVQEKRLWHTAAVVKERTEAFKDYLQALRQLQLHSWDIRSTLLTWLKLP